MMTNTKSELNFHNGWPTSRSGREAIRAEIAVGWDGEDPWGSGLLVLGGLGDALAEMPSAELDYPGAYFAEMREDGIVTIGDLQFWARVMDVFTDLVPEDDRY